MADPLIESFRSQHAVYVAFTKSVDDLLKILLDELGVDLFAIESHTKSIETLLDDTRRQANGDRPNGDKPSLAAAVNDISHLKIVTCLNEDCDKISAVIRRAFEVDEASSADRKDAPGADKFAYRPTRLVVSFGAARTALPEFRRFAGLKAEIEIRTLLQHAWAAINAKFGYKTEADAPREMRRRLYRIGAFLDAADEDFAFMWSQRRGGREALARRAPAPAATNGAPVSFDSLDAFLEGSRSVGQLIDIAEQVGVALSNRPSSADYSATFMGTLQLLEIDGFKGAGEQLDRFNRRGEEILTKLGELVDIRDPGATFTRPGFVRLALMLSTPKARRTKALKKYPIRNVTEDVVAQLPEV